MPENKSHAEVLKLLSELTVLTEQHLNVAPSSDPIDILDKSIELVGLVLDIREGSACSAN